MFPPKRADSYDRNGDEDGHDDNDIDEETSSHDEKMKEVLPFALPAK